MKCLLEFPSVRCGDARSFARAAGPVFLTSLALLCSAVAPTVARGDVKLPSIFSEHLVLQRDLADPVWGSAEPGEEVTVTIADQKHTATADASGKWRVKLAPLPAGGPHHLDRSRQEQQARAVGRAGGRGLDLFGPVEYGMERSRKHEGRRAGNQEPPIFLRFAL